MFENAAIIVRDASGRTVTVTGARRVLILGGGVAGCAASIALARKGRSVTLIEREPTPRHKVCGEFLSGEALEDLHALGIAGTALTHLSSLPARCAPRVILRSGATSSASCSKCGTEIANVRQQMADKHG